MSLCARHGCLAGFTLALALAATTAPVRADEKPVIVVFDVENRGASLGRKIRNRLTDYLCSLMAERGYQVVPRAQIEARLTEQRKTSYKRCYRQACQIELGRELAASKSLATRILRLGTDCKVTLTLYDLKRSATEGAATVSAGCSQQELVRSVEQAASRLAGGGQVRTETVSLWPPACGDGPDCLTCAKARAKQGQHEAAFVAFLAAELRAQKQGNWTIAIRANQAQSLLSMVTMPRKTELERSLSQACKKGKNHEAFMAYARYLLLVSHEKELALEVLDALCHRGKLAAACEDLGDLHAQGKGTRRDHDKAIAARTRACNMGHLVACKDLGTMAMSATGMERNPPRARELFRKACPAHGAGDRGTDGFDPDACHLLGTFEEKGLGGARDETSAAGLYKRACDAGYQPGCVSLGRVHEEGTGVPRDRQRASKLFFASCKAGYADGCAWVGRMMEEGEKVSDPRIQEIAARKAVKYYRKACEGGSLDGCYRLGRCHLTGEGVAKDMDKARALLSRSCSFGIEGACGLLASASDTTSTRDTVSRERHHGPRRMRSPAPAPKPSVADHIDHGTVDLKKWGHVTFWSGIAVIGIGCTISMVDMSSDDEDMSGTSEGILWASVGTGSVLMLTGLVMMLKDTPLPSSTISAGPTVDGSGLAVSFGGTW